MKHKLENYYEIEYPMPDITILEDYLELLELSNEEEDRNFGCLHEIETDIIDKELTYKKRKEAMCRLTKRRPR